MQWVERQKLTDTCILLLSADWVLAWFVQAQLEQMAEQGIGLDDAKKRHWNQGGGRPWGHAQYSPLDMFTQFLTDHAKSHKKTHTPKSQDSI